MALTPAQLHDLITRAASVILESEGADEHAEILAELEAAARELAGVDVDTEAQS